MLADVVLLAHAAFILFAVLGGVLALRWRRVVWLHVPAVIWGAAVELLGATCPLTPLENRLRQASGATGYAESFVERYLLPVVYPGELTRELQVGLGLALVAVNAAVYAAVWRQTR